MGFLSGFTGGVTLTLGVAYLTVLTHERNRKAQALHLRSQSQLLTSLVEPTSASAGLSRAEVARDSRSTFTETAKERWNEEIENAVRWVQHTDWNGVREGMEAQVARLLGGGLQKSREGIESVEGKAKPVVQDAINKVNSTTGKAVNEAPKKVDQALTSARHGAGRAAIAAQETLDRAAVKARELESSAKAKADRITADVKSGANQASRSTSETITHGTDKAREAANDTRAQAYSTGAGTVDTARGALRDVVSKGIEKGKEMLGKAQDVVAVASENVESKVAGVKTSSSPTERILEQRYQKPNGLNKTVEEALAERYKPMDERDNTVLRGV